MISLSNFFQKFKHLEKNKQVELEEFISLVKNVCGITLFSSEVIMDNTSIQIIASPLKRNEIFMHKEELLEKLKGSGSKVIGLK